MSSYAPSSNNCLDCDCLPVSIPDCLEGLTFQIAASDTKVIIDFIDYQSRVYQYYSESNSNGFVDVNMLDFPARWFNPYLTPILIRVSEAAGERIAFQGEKNDYMCLELTVLDNYAVNFSHVSPYLLENKKYVCCCRDCPVCEPDCPDNTTPDCQN